MLFLRAFVLVAVVISVVTAMNHFEPGHSHPKWHALQFGAYAIIGAMYTLMMVRDE